MNFDVLQSFAVGGDLFADHGESNLNYNLKTTNSDVFLNSGLTDEDYNILNLDSFVPKDGTTNALIDHNADNTFNSAEHIDPKIFLLDMNSDRFEDLLKNDIDDKTTGNYKPNVIKTEFLFRLSLIQISRNRQRVADIKIGKYIECVRCSTNIRVYKL